MLCFSKHGIQLQRNCQVCHTVAAKWIGFHEKSKGYINNPRNCRFQFWDMVCRKRILGLKGGLGDSEGASEVEANASESV